MMSEKLQLVSRNLTRKEFQLHQGELFLCHLERPIYILELTEKEVRYMPVSSVSHCILKEERERMKQMEDIYLRLSEWSLKVMKIVEVEGMTY